eukprot:TRINITY_DN29480_c0_g1_i1.p1 TRINITY_DN29480_c0_g1~~TRINITY_DN29480_c0_g1_i1.p1  ORF type:complete len:374 (-),score=70.73 TRINITY_DN29480_c0_g1_i1:42-1073(-)
MRIDESANFAFAIDAPQRQSSGGMFDSFWLYTVHTKTHLSSFVHKEFTVQRRFSDFTWVRDMLATKFPGVILPPTPSKSIAGDLEKIVEVDTEILLNTRQRLLLQFVVGVGAHPQLHKSDLFQIFLTLPYNEWQEYLLKNTAPKPALKSTVKDLFSWGGSAQTALKPELERLRTLCAARMDAITLCKGKLDLLLQVTEGTGDALQGIATALSKVALSDTDERHAAVELRGVSRSCNTAAGLQSRQAATQVVQLSDILWFHEGKISASMDIFQKLSRKPTSPEAFPDIAGAEATFKAELEAHQKEFLADLHQFTRALAELEVHHAKQLQECFRSASALTDQFDM